MSDRSSFDLLNRNIYLCTGIRDDMLTFLPEVLTGGVDVVQLREKRADARSIMHHAEEMLKITKDFGVPLFINDRPDIALEIGADGVHVGQDDVSVELVRKIVPNVLVGLSTHSESELNASLGIEVDYISAGPIVETPTKPGRSGTGISYAEYATSTSRKPVFVTGGITPESVKELVQAGIHHFVVVRYLTEASNPLENAKKMRDAVQKAINQQ